MSRIVVAVIAFAILCAWSACEVSGYLTRPVTDAIASVRVTS